MGFPFFTVVSFLYFSFACNSYCIILVSRFVYPICYPLLFHGLRSHLEKKQKEKRDRVLQITFLYDPLLRYAANEGTAAAGTQTKGIKRRAKATSLGQEKEERAHTGALRDHAVGASILKNQFV